MTDRVLVSPSPAELREAVDAVLLEFLDAKRSEVSALHVAATAMVDELERLVRAGGRRIRPALAYWGYRAAGGEPDGRIIRAAASTELFHSFALIHDDLMDDADERRGAPSVHAHVRTSLSQHTPDAARVGASVAILTGALAAVWADELLLTSGFDAPRLTRALARAYSVRTDMAVGQYLDVSGEAAMDAGTARLAANLKGGGYTVAGPLLLGAELASPDPLAPDLVRALTSFGDPLGEAFQLRDDLDDGDASHPVTADTVDALVATAMAALADAGSNAVAIAALSDLAGMI